MTTDGGATTARLGMCIACTDAATDARYKMAMPAATTLGALTSNAGYQPSTVTNLTPAASATTGFPTTVCVTAARPTYLLRPIDKCA